jgi:predicted PurR-regulated permease PerM
MTKHDTSHIAVTLSWKSLFRVALGITFVYIVLNFRQIVLLLALAYILSATAQFISTKFSARNIRPELGIAAFYGSLVGVSTLTFSLLVPLLLIQAKNLQSTFPYFTENTSRLLNELGFGVLGAQIFDSSILDIVQFSYQPLVTILTEFTSILTFVAIAVIISIYVALQGDRLEDWLVRSSLLPFQSEVIIWKQFKNFIGRWMVGQIILGLSMTFLTSVVFTVLGVEYGFLFATLLGVAEGLPFVGPIVLSICITLFLALQSPLYAVFFIVYYFLIQLLKGYIFTPLVHRSRFNMHPVILIAIAGVGYLLFGWIGVITIIPFGVGVHHILIQLYS